MNLNLFAPAATSRVDAVPSYSDYYYIRILSGDYDLSSFEYDGDWQNASGNYIYYAISEGGFSIDPYVDLPIAQLQRIIGKEIQLKATFGGEEHIYDENNIRMTGYQGSDFGDPEDGYHEGYYKYYLNVTIVALGDMHITYKDAGGADFSGSHASGYPARHTNGTATTLDTPTKTNYTFLGYYLNDPTCAASNLVTTLSAATEYETITLYAKWEPVVITITLTCSNYSEAAPNYMMYIYKNDTLTCQVVPTGATYQLKVLAPELATGDTYTVVFVFGYYGQFSATPPNGVEVNGRKLKITSITNKTITYTLVTPRINSTVII